MWAKRLKEHWLGSPTANQTCPNALIVLFRLILALFSFVLSGSEDEFFCGMMINASCEPTHWNGVTITLFSFLSLHCIVYWSFREIIKSCILVLLPCDGKIHCWKQILPGFFILVFHSPWGEWSCKWALQTWTNPDLGFVEREEREEREWFVS